MEFTNESLYIYLAHGTSLSCKRDIFLYTLYLSRIMSVSLSYEMNYHDLKIRVHILFSSLREDNLSYSMLGRRRFRSLSIFQNLITSQHTSVNLNSIYFPTEQYIIFLLDLGYIKYP